MARRLSSLIFALAALACAASAQAQQLQRLHVRSFTLTTDTEQPKLDVPFNVTLTIWVAENVQLQNVYLPAFAGPEELGDVREQHRSPSGTLYRETLMLVAHAPGALSIGSAYLDAIDASDGKPKRFSSNGLQLNVSGPPVPVSWSGRAIIWMVAIVCGLALFAIFRSKRRVAAPRTAASPLPPQETAARDPNPLATALLELRTRRDRAAVMRVRSVLWHIAGARSGQTLQDVLQLAPAADGDLRAMLAAVECAAFVEQDRLEDAIDDMLALQKGVVA